MRGRRSSARSAGDGTPPTDHLARLVRPVRARRARSPKRAPLAASKIAISSAVAPSCASRTSERLAGATCSDQTVCEVDRRLVGRRRAPARSPLVDSRPQQLFRLVELATGGQAAGRGASRRRARRRSPRPASTRTASTEQRLGLVETPLVHEHFADVRLASSLRREGCRIRRSDSIAWRYRSTISSHRCRSTRGTPRLLAMSAWPSRSPRSS